MAKKATPNPDFYKKLLKGIKYDRKSIGLYSKLSVTFAVIGVKENKKVSAFLSNSKHTHSTYSIQNVCQIYTINLDSIEKAYAFKLKIKKIIKDGIQTRKPSVKRANRKNT